MATKFGTVGAARDGVVEMITRDIRERGIECEFNQDSPDGDPSKFTINGKVARAIHIYNGYHLPIRLEWFTGDYVLPTVKRGEFYYYVFAIEPKLSFDVPDPHYFIVDYLTVRKWVLEFNAPVGRDWRDQKHWMANIRPSSDGTAYFRWGDEPLNDSRRSREINLDNLGELVGLSGERVYVLNTVNTVVIALLDGQVEEMPGIDGELVEQVKAAVEQVKAAITGEKAEKYFLHWVSKEHPEWGKPIDKTDKVGLGYDIEFTGESIKKVEVKGCRGNIENLRFTKLEWNKARDIGSSYILAIVSKLDANPKVDLIHDPYNKLQNDAKPESRPQITYVLPSASIRIYTNAG